MEINWFEVWYSDKVAILSMMYKNMSDDIAAGYNPCKDSIRHQMDKIIDYAKQFDTEMKHLRELNDKQADHWCYIDLRRRGVIS